MTNETKTGHPTELTQDELLSLLQDRFGNDPMDWAFQCPQCGDIASGKDFSEALKAKPLTRTDGSKVMASDIFGQQCVGRLLGVLSVPPGEWEGRGCDWSAFGLFRGPVRVTTAEGGEMFCFPVAPAPGV